MGQWLSKLWPEAPNPSIVEIEGRQRAEADTEQARKEVEAAQAEFATLIQSNQESQKRAMEDKLAAIQAAQEQARQEMIAMIQAERAVNEARLMAETAAQAANEEARQRAAEEEERKRTVAAQEQVERDARQVQAHEEMMATMETEWAAHKARLKAETTAHQEAKKRAAAKAEEEQKRAAAVQEQVIKDVQEHARKVEEAAKEDNENINKAAYELKKAAKEEVKRAEEDAERKLREELKKAEEDAERKLREELKKAEEDAERKLNEVKKTEEDAERKLQAEIKKANAVKEDAERKLKKGIQPVVTPTPEEVRDTKQRVQYCEDCFHLAVAGTAGGGKSSLINAFRGLRNNDSGAAATGVTETTMAITRYANPDEDPYVWYDIPGAGTFKIPDWLYFNAQGLYIFDCIIVMFDSRFTMADIAILTNCRRFNIPMYIVRSKADQHIRNLMEDLPPVGHDSKDGDKGRDQTKKLYQAARKKFIQETRQCVKNNLEDANIPDQKVYIVSKETMVGVVKEKRPKEVIDEIELLNDLVWEGQARRGQRDGGAVTAIKDMLQSITSI